MRSVYCIVTLVFRPLYKTRSFEEETRERLENPTRISSPGIIAAGKGPCEEIKGLGAGLVAAGRTLGGGFTGPGAAVVVSGFGVKVAGTGGVGACELPGVVFPGGLGGRVGGALSAEACGGGVVGVAEALWAVALGVCGAGACEAGCATTEVRNNSGKTGKRPSATRLKARGPKSICLKGGSAPGIFLKPIPHLGPGARGHLGSRAAKSNQVMS